MRNAGLEEAQAGTKTAGRSIISMTEAVDASPVTFPARDSSSPVCCMMYSAYKLNKQGDHVQPWHPPFSIWNQSTVSCPVLTVVS